jgi:hypothetical protein
MWMMEYCRDEGVRGYWNSWSAPYHQEGNDQVFYNYLTDAERQQYNRMGGTQTVQVGEAYLHVVQEGVAPESLMMVFDDDDVQTKVSEVFRLGVEHHDKGYYSLDGKTVDSPGKGLYIHNGKKMVRTVSSRRN